MPESRIEALESRAALVAPATGAAEFADLYVDGRPTVVGCFRLPDARPGERVRVEHLTPDWPGSAVDRIAGEDRTIEIELREGTHFLRFTGEAGVGCCRIDAVMGEDAPEAVVAFAPRRPIVFAVVDMEGRPVAVPELRVYAWARVVVGGSPRRFAFDAEDVDGEGLADLSRVLLAFEDPDVANEVEAGSDRIGLESETLRISGADLVRRIRESEGPVVIPLVVTPRETEEDEERILIRAVDPGGRPVSGVGFGSEWDDGATATTDEHGLARIREGWLPRIPWIGRWDDVDEYAPEPVPYPVEPARAVAVRVLDESGLPAPGLWVSRAEGDSSERTDESGRATLVVPARLRELDLRGEDAWIGCVPVPQGTDEVTVRARPFRRIWLTARGPDALGIESSLGLTWSAEVPSGTDDSGEEGVGRDGAGWSGTIRVPPFPAEVRVVTSNLRWAATARVPVDVGEVALELRRLPEHEVRLLLLDPDGRPLADRPVKGASDAFSAGLFVPRGARTGPDGTLVLRVPEGAHEIPRLEVDDLFVPGVAVESPSTGVVEVRLGR